MNCIPAFFIGVGSAFLVVAVIYLMNDIILKPRKQKEKKSVDQKITYIIDLIEKNEKLRKERGY